MELAFKSDTPIYSPFPDDCEFVSEDSAVLYAKNAGFDVSMPNGLETATREDMPGTTFTLAPNGRKFFWERNKGRRGR